MKFKDLPKWNSFSIDTPHQEMIDVMYRYNLAAEELEKETNLKFAEKCAETFRDLEDIVQARTRIIAEKNNRLQLEILQHENQENECLEVEKKLRDDIKSLQEKYDNRNEFKPLTYFIMSEIGKGAVKFNSEEEAKKYAMTEIGNGKLGAFLVLGLVAEMKFSWI